MEMREPVASAGSSCDDGRVNRPIGYLVKRLDASLEMLFDATLSSLSLTRRQWKLLSALSSGALTREEIDDVLKPFDSADRGDAQEREMAALVRKRFVFLLDDRLSLTSAGSALLSEVSGLVEATRRDITAGIGADEYAMAVSVLERMTNNAYRLATR